MFIIFVSFKLFRSFVFPELPQEGKRMLTLRHPHLVPVYQCGDYEKGGYSVLGQAGVIRSFFGVFFFLIVWARITFLHSFLVIIFSQGIRFIEMELLDGDLHSEIRKNRLGHLPPEVCARFLKHISSGLMHLNGKGLIHRDIKPANVFVIGSVAKIRDFGLTVESAAPDLQVCRTPQYLPFDLWNSEVPMSVRADIWDLEGSCTVYGV